MQERSVAAIASRDQDIREKYLNGGASLRQLAAEHGISHERVRQVLEAAGISGARIQRTRKKLRAQAAIERRCIRRFGVSVGVFSRIRDNDVALRREGITLGVIRCFNRDRRRAMKARIAWDLNLEQYQWVWIDFGRWDRGTIAKPEYQLGRLDRSEGFTYSNTVIDPVRPQRAAVKTRRERKNALPVGVRATGRRFVAVLRDGGVYRRFGPFPTPEAASTAYLNARHASAA